MRSPTAAEVQVYFSRFILNSCNNRLLLSVWLFFISTSFIFFVEATGIDINIGSSYSDCDKVRIAE